MSWLEILSLLTLAAWAVQRLDRSRAWPSDRSLPEPTTAASERRITALVPARNEAGLLPRTLPSLLGQAGPRVEVIVIDDGSTDGTAEVARRTAAAVGAADRLRVIEAAPTPEGWAGKVWALECGRLQAGRSLADGWLLLTDADIRHRPGAAAALLARAEGGDERFDLVSVMARLRVDRFWERVLIPAFLFFFHLLYPFRRVARPGTGTAAAAGGCILVRAETLSACGGFGAVRSASIDDLALARAVAEHGGRLWLGLDPGIESVRSYGGLRGVWRMVERTAFTQLRYRWSLLAATLAGLGLLVASPPLLLAAGAWLHLGAAPAGPVSPARAAVWALLAWGLQALALLPAVRHHRVPSIYAWSLPIAGLLYGAMTARSAVRHALGRGPRWKGRPVNEDR